MKAISVVTCLFAFGFPSVQAHAKNEPVGDAPVGDAPKPGNAGTPIDKVIVLIRDLAAQISQDGKAEQAAYDEYACWVEDTLQRKAKDISDAKELIPQLDGAIKAGKAAIASHNAEIEQLEKDIAQAKEAIREATAIRDKEYKEYSEERTESEQCIGALEAAIKVLTGAGTKKEGGFLQQLQEAQLMSVSMGVRKVLQHVRTASVVSSADLDVVKRFVENPGAFARQAQGVSAAQVGQNPFGDYAPQSSQIQGILKAMYDEFTGDLEKENAEEANKEKTFQELFGTKQQELKTLEVTLEKQETDKASKQKKLAEDEALRQDTIEQLDADEVFFADTKEAAEAKADEWSTRTRLRTEELAGMEGAIQILQGGDKVFDEAHTTFLQLKSVKRHTSDKATYGELKALAAKYKSSSLAKVIAVMKAGGHFDKVIMMINTMIEVLRKEEQEDIEHRDRCQNEANGNSNEIEDNEQAISKSEAQKERQERSKEDKEKALEEVELQIAESKKKLQEMLDMRNEEVAAFRRAQKVDTEAIDLISQAIVKLSKYYKENDIPLKLMQQPEYTEDPDKAPEAKFGDAGMHKQESTNIVAILEMIREDLHKEIKEGKADDAKSQEEYEKQSGALEDSLEKQEATKVQLENSIGGLSEDIAQTEKEKDEQEADLDAEKDEKKSIFTDCAWVETHFKSRRENRKREIAGLVEAKDFLAGVAAGEPVMAPGA